MVVEACESGGSFFVPPLIMLERQKNESGYRATDKVDNLALTKEEKEARVPMIGIDWSNWGRKRPRKALTLFAFSELFTNNVGRRQAGRPRQRSAWPSPSAIRLAVPVAIRWKSRHG